MPATVRPTLRSTCDGAAIMEARPVVRCKRWLAGASEAPEFILQQLLLVSQVVTEVAEDSKVVIVTNDCHHRRAGTEQEAVSVHYASRPLQKRVNLSLAEAPGWVRQSAKNDSGIAMSEDLVARLHELLNEWIPGGDVPGVVVERGSIWRHDACAQFVDVGVVLQALHEVRLTEEVLIGGNKGKEAPQARRGRILLVEATEAEQHYLVVCTESQGPEGTALVHLSLKLRNGCPQILAEAPVN